MQQFGVIGLSVMGKNLALNVKNHGYSVSGFSIDKPEVDALAKYEDKDLKPTYTWEEFVNSLEKPRKILIQIMAGKPVDETLQKLLPLLDKGDILIDGKSITNAKGKNLRELRRDIGMIFQNFNLVERTTVQKNVLAGRSGYYPTWKTMLGL